MFLQYVLIGLGIGGIYALAGQGVVLVYRGSGVVNFAVGPMAMVGAFTFYEAQGAGWSPIAAAGAGVILPSVIGALTYLLVMRRLADATPLVRVVAILAVSALLLALAAGKYGDFPYLVRPLLPQEPVAWIANAAGSDVEVTADRMWLFLLGAAVSAVCWAVYKFTRFGLVTRAVAEKPMAAATLGRSPHIVGTVNWAIGGALAGLSGLLLVGITGLAVGQFNLLMVPALAAALLGRFQSFPLTWITGVTMGVVETLLNSNASWLPEFLTQPGWAAQYPFWSSSVSWLRGARRFRHAALSSSVSRTPAPAASAGSSSRRACCSRSSSEQGLPQLDTPGLPSVGCLPARRAWPLRRSPCRLLWLLGTPGSCRSRSIR